MRTEGVLFGLTGKDGDEETVLEGRGWSDLSERVGLVGNVE